LPWLQAVAACGQLGVPIAAVALGIQTRALEPGEGAGILLGALITIVIATVATSFAARRGGALPIDRSGAPASGAA
jgi:hypothetical protein